MLRRIVILLSVVAVLGVTGAGLAAVWARRWLESPIPALVAPATFEIERGTPLKAVAVALAERGWLEHPRLWSAWARVTGQAQGIKAGEYEIEPGVAPLGLLELFNSGKVLLHSVTFIEGSTFAEIRSLLESNAVVAANLAQASGEDIMAALGRRGVAPEGQFFPDTYRFARGTTELELLRLAADRMSVALSDAWASRAPDLPLAGPYEALVLASIVEKETGLDAERARIAGVFVARLRLGMRLQTDPAVIYGLGDSFDGNLRRADLERDTPYNTYTRTGLPPTPIALPGAAALAAAVRPDVSGALYFVATGNGDGSHYFSKTLEEHQAAVQRYLRKLRERR
jgi:peptidoglycan lytic transglycosylase G